MAEQRPRKREYGEEFTKKAEGNESRKMRARREKDRAVWFGLGMFGVVGWSVTVPTLIGAAMGIWIDSKWPSRFSWTLMLLFVGVVIGCLNAWYWVQQMIERREEGKKK